MNATETNSPPGNANFRYTANSSMLRYNFASSAPADSLRAAHDAYHVCVIEGEVAALAASYGAPLRRKFTLPADEATRIWRFSGNRSDRRAEVVFAIQDANGGVWTHTKRHYQEHIYRLPSGGINWAETVEAALLREVAEETALDVQITRFLGVLEYRFQYMGQIAPFASYIFLLRSAGGAPQPLLDQSIAGFRLVTVAQLLQTACDLRALPAERRNWGKWRALAHDLVHEALEDDASQTVV